MKIAKVSSGAPPWPTSVHELDMVAIMAKGGSGDALSGDKDTIDLH